MARVVVRPVTAATWDHFVHLFEARGGPHYCFCAPYRFRDAHALSNPEKKARTRKLVAGATPIGVLAYEGDEPFDSAGISATHRGHSSVFEGARFRRDPDGARWSLRVGGR